MPLDVGTWLLIAGLSYGFGVLWHDFLPGQRGMAPWRIAVYPFVAIFIAQALFQRGPEFGGVFLVPAVIATVVGVAVDWILYELRRHEQMEQRVEPSKA